MKYEKAEVINLKTHKEYNEKWLQARIEEDPMILGLGDIQFRHTEKILVGGGRLDTILYDPESNKRYEVEIQLGKTDESHIIRTIEYWDIERKRNDRTCRRPASWPKDNAATLSPVDKVLDDQKIAIVAHIVEHAQLHIEALQLRRRQSLTNLLIAHRLTFCVRNFRITAPHALIHQVIQKLLF